MEYRLSTNELVGTLTAWDETIPGRGTDVDIEDSLALIKNEQVDLKKLEKRYRETAKYYFGEDKVLKNLEILWTRLKKVKS